MFQEKDLILLGSRRRRASIFSIAVVHRHKKGVSDDRIDAIGLSDSPCDPPIKRRWDCVPVLQFQLPNRICVSTDLAGLLKRGGVPEQAIYPSFLQSPLSLSYSRFFFELPLPLSLFELSFSFHHPLVALHLPISISLFGTNNNLNRDLGQLSLNLPLRVVNATGAPIPVLRSSMSYPHDPGVATRGPKGPPGHASLECPSGLTPFGRPH